MDMTSQSARRGRSNPRRENPVPPSPIDVVIGHHGGSTVALEATRERLKASKQCPIPPLSERIEQLSIENGHLRHEIVYYQEMFAASRKLQEDVQYISDKLQRVLARFHAIRRQLDQERFQIHKHDGHI